MPENLRSIPPPPIYGTESCRSRSAARSWVTKLEMSISVQILVMHTPTWLGDLATCGVHVKINTGTNECCLISRPALNVFPGGRPACVHYSCTVAMFIIVPFCTAPAWSRFQVRSSSATGVGAIALLHVSHLFPSRDGLTGSAMSHTCRGKLCEWK